MNIILPTCTSIPVDLPSLLCPALCETLLTVDLGGLPVLGPLLTALLGQTSIADSLTIPICDAICVVVTLPSLPIQIPGVNCPLAICGQVCLAINATVSLTPPPAPPAGGLLNLRKRSVGLLEQQHASHGRLSALMLGYISSVYVDLFKLASCFASVCSVPLVILKGIRCTLYLSCIPKKSAKRFCQYIARNCNKLLIQIIVKQF